MIDINRVLQRLKFMTQRLNRLQELRSLTLEDYEINLDSQLVAERILELIIQSAIDINSHIIKQSLKLNNITPQESFIILKDYNILPNDLAQELSRSVNFRNILAHEY